MWRDVWEAALFMPQIVSEGMAEISNPEQQSGKGRDAETEENSQGIIVWPWGMILIALNGCS